MKTRALIKRLSKNFPKSIAKKYHDYVGTMVGPLPDEVHTIALVLDLDLEVLPAVLNVNPDLIMTHHPFFYGNKKKILEHDEQKREIVRILKEHHIAVISMHTNFDEGKEGMNDALANALSLQNIYAPENCPIMRIGTLPTSMPAKEYARFAKEMLHVDYALLVGNEDVIVKKVGIVGGGGSREYPYAIEEGCDIYISGDAPHYVRRDITLRPFTYLDVPHEVENIFVDQMKRILLSLDPSFEIASIRHEKMPTVIL